MAELVDALASGASASNGVKVQVLLSAPNQIDESLLAYFIFSQRGGSDHCPSMNVSFQRACGRLLAP
jgi:hypothetical protein